MPQSKSNAPAQTDVEAEALEDLMDPAHAHHAPEPSGQEADDLLASMADEAIDRMLAGDEGGPAPARPDAQAKPQSDPLPDLSDDEAAALAQDQEEQDKKPSAVAASDDEQLDALLRGDTDVVPASKPVPPKPAEPARDASAAVAAELEADLAQSPASKEADLDALMAGEDADEPKPAPAAVEAKPEPRSVPASAVPLYLRPLVWINRPLDGSPSARDAVGKVALLTLLNATGLFVYVLLRR